MPQESIEPFSPDELLDLVLELDTFFYIMIMVMMIEAILVGIMLTEMRVHPLRSR